MSSFGTAGACLSLIVLVGLAACQPLEVDADAAPGQARVFEAPRTIMRMETSEGGTLSMVFVRGNTYQTYLDGKDATDTVSASTKPGFSNVGAPNAEDAATAYEISLTGDGRIRFNCPNETRLRIDVTDTVVDARTETQTWTMLAACR